MTHYEKIRVHKTSLMFCAKKKHKNTAVYINRFVRRNVTFVALFNKLINNSFHGGHFFIYSNFYYEFIWLCCFVVHEIIMGVTNIILLFCEIIIFYFYCQFVNTYELLISSDL